MLSLKKTLLASSLLVLASCSGDDTDEWNAVEVFDGTDGLILPDSIAQSDTLYGWYLKDMAPGALSSEKAESSSGATNSSGASSSSAGSCSSGNSSSGSSSSVSSSSSSAGLLGDSVYASEDYADASKLRLLPPAGFYSEITIPVPAPQYGGVIRCTFDGSEPTSVTTAFTSPYTVTKNTAVRCAEFVGDSVARKSSHTYFINENVSMPVVAISIDPYQMFDPLNGYYSQGVRYCTEPCYEANYWKDIELPVHVEYFEKGSSAMKRDWQIDAGLSIIGQWSRYRAKKSVAIKMKSEYQDGRLKYPIFKTRPEDNKFKAFNLRNNGNRFVGDYIEDPVLSSLLEGSGVDYQRSRQVVVFYNGTYYGIHDLRERLNEHYIETNYGIDSKEVNMVKHIKKDVTASGGTVDSYVAMLDFIHAHDFSTDTAAYTKLKTMMDVGNYADYMAAEIYYHNGDWPDNNVRAWNTADRPFKFLVFDLDHGFGWDWAVSGFNYVSHNMFSWIKRGGTNLCNGEHCFAEIYIKLIENPDFRRLFINHAAVMLDYYLTYQKLVEATDAMTATIPSSEMDRDIAKYPKTEHSFDRTGETLKSYASTRTTILRAEISLEFGLGQDISVEIASTGKGKVLLDGMTLPSNDYTGRFFEYNDMLLTAVPLEGGVFDSWEDGSKANPRLVTPSQGSKYTAKFK